MPGEDPRHFEGLLEDLTAEHHPASVSEQILVEKMAQNQWLSLRTFRLQGEAFTTHRFGPAGSLLPPDLPVLIRYRTTADNPFVKHLNELLRLKKQRLNSEIGFEPQSYSQEVPEAPEPVPNFPVRARDLVFTEEEMNFDLCPEALEFFKNLG